MILQRNQLTVKTLDKYIHQHDINGLCNAIDDFVTNPAKKPILPRVQNLTQNFAIPPRVKEIQPTPTEDMVQRGSILRVGCKANVLYKQYKHLYWNNQDLLFDLLRELQTKIINGDTLNDVKVDPTQFRYVFYTLFLRSVGVIPPTQNPFGLLYRLI